jgi:hypothetical protein
MKVEGFYGLIVREGGRDYVHEYEVYIEISGWFASRKESMNSVRCIDGDRNDVSLLRKREIAAGLDGIARPRGE